jgi:hypothetical protein
VFAYPPPSAAFVNWTLGSTSWRSPQHRPVPQTEPLNAFVAVPPGGFLVWSVEPPPRGKVTRPFAETAQDLGTPKTFAPTSFVQWSVLPLRVTWAPPKHQSAPDLGTPKTFAPTSFVIWSVEPTRKRVADQLRRFDVFVLEALETVQDFATWSPELPRARFAQFRQDGTVSPPPRWKSESFPFADFTTPQPPRVMQPQNQDPLPRWRSDSFGFVSDTTKQSPPRAVQPQTEDALPRLVTVTDYTEWSIVPPPRSAEWRSQPDQHTALVTKIPFVVEQYQEWFVPGRVGTNVRSRDPFPPPFVGPFLGVLFHPSPRIVHVHRQSRVVHVEEESRIVHVRSETRIVHVKKP